VPWGVREGLPANFVVFDCADEAEAIRLRPAARWVVRNGRVVAETEPARSTVHVDGAALPVTFRRDPVKAGGAVAAPSDMVGAGPIRARSEEGVER
jgi:cytosine/adenosine deaminase-related metal-dependent hydrolase